MKSEESKRIEWLDAMRGFTMILVVAYHVAQFGFVENEKTSAALPFLVLFRMPLFFFVSGFLAYKANFVWNLKNTIPLVLKKLHVQIIPALIFLSIFIIFKSKYAFWEGFLNALKSPTKDGYWFTWVLLQMFLIYYTISIIAHYLKKIKEKVSGKNSQLSTFNFRWFSGLPSGFSPSPHTKHCTFPSSSHTTRTRSFPIPVSFRPSASRSSSFWAILYTGIGIEYKNCLTAFGSSPLCQPWL